MKPWQRNRKPPSADMIGRSQKALTHDDGCCDSRRTRAFTLLEVMIALAIFFMAIFVILQSTSQSLGGARLLQQKQTMPDLGILIGDLSLTNRIEEGIVEGDFGDLYPGATWARESYLIMTNGLMQLDFTIRWFNGKKAMESKSSILFWDPNPRVTTPGGIRR